MRRARSRAVLPLAPLLLATLLLGTLAIAAGETGESKTFAAQNFQWTLPSREWTFLETSASEKRDGYVARAVKRFGGDSAALADVFAYVSPTGGLTLDERMKELAAAAESDMSVVTKRGFAKAKLSGIDGSVAVVRGEAATGGRAVFLYYGILQKDTFHHLLVKTFQGAGAKFGAEIDLLRRSYRLLQGAGADEPAPAAGKSLVEIEAKADGDAPAAPAPGGGAKPGGGMTQEGNVYTWPEANVKWTLPATPEWKVLRTQGKDEKLRLGLALPGIKEPPPPGMQPDDTPPPDGQCLLLFSFANLPVNSTPFELLQNVDVQKRMSDDSFDKQDTTKTQVIREVTIGNWKGSAVQFFGTQGDGFRYKRVYVAQLRGIQYEWHVVMDGAKNVDDVFKGALKGLLDGVAFLETKEGVRGPVAAAGIQDTVVTRGKAGDGKEKAYSGVAAKRPKDWYEIENRNGENGHQFSWETRSADGSSYQYLTLRVLRADDLGGLKFEDIVEKREGVWKQAAGDPVTQKAGKTSFDASLRGAKGVGYRFTGTFGDNPFVETGWVVKSKGLVFVVYHQYGGKDAEKAADKAAKAVDNFIRFEK